MRSYSFSDGHIVTSKLNTAELLKRMKRLDCLRVLTEGYESGEGHTIFQKVWRAYLCDLAAVKKVLEMCGLWVTQGVIHKCTLSMPNV